MFIIENKGEDLAKTNYWTSEHAKNGLMYLSGNAEVWRMLVPNIVKSYVTEMQTARSVLIEPSLANSACWDIVFEDGSDQPFVVTLDKRQVDRAMESGKMRLTVWTTAGKHLDFPCIVKV
tara:strand:+ start:594 stop:953 length:360 start_codon:yes stop_codon:yes gene_type:complete